jgi:quercetin dioxygenase-like cupin family protein
MLFLNLRDLEEKEPMPGFRGRFVHSENMTLAYWDIAAGAPLPEHSHASEQITMIIEGELRFTVNGETNVLGPGAVAIVQSKAIHSGEALTRCRLIDVFYPVREDYR